MKKIIYIVVLIVSGIFTSCTDTSEEVIDSIENDVQLIGGDDEQIPIEDDEED